MHQRLQISSIFWGKVSPTLGSGVPLQAPPYNSSNYESLDRVYMPASDTVSFTF